MSLRLVPESVTLNDLEQRNGRYFALFQRIFLYDIAVKQLLGLPRFQNLLLILTILKRSAQLSDYLGKTKLLMGFMGVRE